MRTSAALFCARLTPNPQLCGRHCAQNALHLTSFWVCALGSLLMVQEIETFTPRKELHIPRGFFANYSLGTPVDTMNRLHLVIAMQSILLGAAVVIIIFLYKRPLPMASLPQSLFLGGRQRQLGTYARSRSRNSVQARANSIQLRALPEKLRRGHGYR